MGTSLSFWSRWGAGRYKPSSVNGSRPGGVRINPSPSRVGVTYVGTGFVCAKLRSCDEARYWP